tara:strand:- start:273 stop:377 length:105 start_codon:yes stop_codon:yes gene_type:complete
LSWAIAPVVVDAAVLGWIRFGAVAIGSGDDSQPF